MRRFLVPAFLLIEAVLYYLILTAGGQTLVWSSYSAIVLCFLFALAHIRSGSFVAVAALACTVGADFCLVVCSPQQQLWGMVFFLAAQILYGIRLHIRKPSRKILCLRLTLIVLVEAVTVAVLRDKTDALALVSVCYYANLLTNALQAFTQWQKDKAFPLGLVLFILCDTVIGLQVASGGYLPISPDGWLYRVLFMGFHLSWFFYLPSQVLIALSARKK